MPQEASLETWSDAIEAACARTGRFRAVRVLRETGSTQDAAAASGLGPGAVIVAGRQRQGRGRLGSAWMDTEGHGLAVTCMVEPLPPERLAIASAVAVAETVAAWLPPEAAAQTGIKWPNDIVVAWPDGGRRKLCGILVERTDAVAMVGVGVNVGQAGFPDPLHDTAASLRMLGSTATRLDVLLELVVRLDRWLDAEPDRAAAAWARLDRTVGLRMRFRTPAGSVEGTVTGIDVARGLRVRTSEGEQVLPAATTRVEPGHP